MKPVIAIAPQLYDALVAHILPEDVAEEQVAFLYLKPAPEVGCFDVIEQTLVPPEGFFHQSAYHLELSDNTRATVIKTAHDLEASLAEVHSHPSPLPAAFSSSDLTGLVEFVPHVWWRLKGRPYFAFVFGLTSYDSLAWLESASAPSTVDHIRVASDVLRPTDITLKRRIKG